MIVTIISIYLAIGLAIAFLVDIAYIQRDKGVEHFKDITGDMTMGGRIITILLWPVVLVIAITALIKEQTRRGDGD